MTDHNHRRNEIDRTPTGTRVQRILAKHLPRRKRAVYLTGAYVAPHSVFAFIGKVISFSLFFFLSFFFSPCTGTTQTSDEEDRKRIKKKKEGRGEPQDEYRWIYRETLISWHCEEFLALSAFSVRWSVFDRRPRRLDTPGVAQLL